MLYISNWGIAKKLRGNSHMARECDMDTLNSNKSPDISRKEADCLNPNRARHVVEYDYVGMTTLPERKKFVLLNQMKT